MTQLQQIAQTANDLIDIAEIASLRTRIDDEKIKPFLSARQARRKFGRDFQLWIDNGLIQGEKGAGVNSVIRYDRITLEALSKATNKAKRKI